MTQRLVDETLRGFTDDLASDAPVPGGGSAAAYAGALGAALAAMVARIAAKKADEAGLRDYIAENYSLDRDEKEALLLRFVKALLESDGPPPLHVHEEAREAGWTDEQILEAVAVVAMEGFTAMVNVAGDVPVDGSTEDTRTLRAA